MDVYYIQKKPTSARVKYFKNKKYCRGDIMAAKKKKTAKKAAKKPAKKKAHSCKMC